MQDAAKIAEWHTYLNFWLPILVFGVVLFVYEVWFDQEFLKRQDRANVLRAESVWVARKSLHHQQKIHEEIKEAATMKKLGDIQPNETHASTKEKNEEFSGVPV